jgi:transposase-like protein
MHQRHDSTTEQRVRRASEMIAYEGKYGAVSGISQSHGVSRQTLYSWKERAETALEEAFETKEGLAEREAEVERAVLTLLTEAHASERGIQVCLEQLLGLHVSLGKISNIVQEAGKRAQAYLASQMPSGMRSLALDEQYGSKRGEAYFNIVDVQSGLVVASVPPLPVNGENWLLLLWQMQYQGLTWKTLVSDGGRAIQDAVEDDSLDQVYQRDVWHVEHECQKVQARLDRVVQELEKQASTVARQAERVARGEKPRGANPKSDVQAHSALLQRARYIAWSLRYLTGELKRLLEVVVLAPTEAFGILSAHQRDQELQALLALFAELWQTAPEGMRGQLEKLWKHVQSALPYLVSFTGELEALQQEMSQKLGPEAMALIGWAWQHRATLGPKNSQVLAGLPAEWWEGAAALFSGKGSGRAGQQCGRELA